MPTQVDGPQGRAVGEEGVLKALGRMWEEDIEC